MILPELLLKRLESLKNLRTENKHDYAYRNTCLRELDLEIKIAILTELQNIHGVLKGER